MPVLLPLVILMGTGLRGLELGQHWDERNYQIGPMETMIRSGQPLPGYYGYPSFDYWISIAAAIPDAVVELTRGPGARERVLDRIDTHGFLLRLRRVFLGICALAVLWVYLLVLSWWDSVPEALLASTLLATSWEVAYHSRWIATDGVLMQFGALTILLVMRSQLRPLRERWLFLAAVAAGLGAGTKYPGGLLLVPVLVGGWFVWRERLRLGAVLGRLVALAGVAFATFLLTTPAVVLAPSAVLEGMAFEIHHYAYGHYGHTVPPGLRHLLRMARYLGTVLFSWYGPVAVFLASLCLVGVWALRREPRVAVLLLSFPVVYSLYFASQRALVVRNLLVLAPFLAILAAHGAQWIWSRTSAAGRQPGPGGRVAKGARLGFAALLVSALLVNAGWLWHAASTIRKRKTDAFAREALAYVRERSTTTFYISPRVRTHFALLGAGSLSNVTTDPGRAEHVVFYAHEGARRYQDWHANRPRLTERWFGPYEVNFNMYPNWWGDDRIVVMSAAKANGLGVPVVAQPPPTRDAERIRAAAPAPRQATSWALPDIEPCAILSGAAMEAVVGSAVGEPQPGGTAVDGSACQYTGSGPFVVTLGLMSTKAYESLRMDFGGEPVLGAGFSALADGPDPLGDVTLVARSRDAAVLVRISGIVPNAAGPARRALAAKIAREALDRVP
jgi:4-amino-4-deoxy-L-arabinose transferase-like glycosyltransferase